MEKEINLSYFCCCQDFLNFERSRSFQVFFEKENPCFCSGQVFQRWMCWGLTTNFGIPWDGSGEIQASRCLKTRLVVTSDCILGGGQVPKTYPFCRAKISKFWCWLSERQCVLHWHGTLEMSDRKFLSEVSYHQWYGWDGENPQGEFNKDCYPKHSDGMTNKNLMLLWFLDDPFSARDIFRCPFDVFSGWPHVSLQPSLHHRRKHCGTRKSVIRSMQRSDASREGAGFWMVDLIVRQPLHSRELDF